MAVSMSQARRLCSAAELRVVAASRRASLAALTPARLRQKIAVARKLRDKWRDQARRQRRARQGTARARGAASAAQETRTRRKAQLFQETLARFEKRLAAVEKAARLEARKKARARKKTRARKKARARKKTQATAGGALRELPRAKAREAAAAHADARRKSARFERTAQHRIQGHVSSRGRRHQAKRDKR